MLLSTSMSRTDPAIIKAAFTALGFERCKGGYKNKELVLYKAGIKVGESKLREGKDE